MIKVLLMYYTKLQRSVISMARRSLKKESWYRGVCLDKLPKDSEIRRRGRHWAARELWCETYYWDGILYSLAS